MTHTLEEKEESSRGVRTRSDYGGWARGCALGGAAIWSALAVAARVGRARIGGIELLFLFAPLVIVPLGMELWRINSLPAGDDLRSVWAIRIFVIARWLQPFCAALAVAALFLAPGVVAGALACGWFLVCLLMGAGGVIAVRSSFSRVIVAVAGMDLVVGACWLVASRLGMRPMGIQEPIGLLTAVHFHFAGFATAMIAASMLRFAEVGGAKRWLRLIVALVVGMPYLVAIGFVVSAGVKMAAAAVYSVSVACLAIVLRAVGRRASQRAARILLQGASVAVFAGMVLSSTYAIADFLGSDVLPIPQMARTHGILNAAGFCLLALLGWIVEWDKRLAEARGAAEDL